MRRVIFKEEIVLGCKNLRGTKGTIHNIDVEVEKINYLNHYVTDPFSNQLFFSFFIWTILMEDQIDLSVESSLIIILISDHVIWGYNRDRLNNWTTNLFLSIYLLVWTRDITIYIYKQRLHRSSFKEYFLTYFKIKSAHLF